MTAMLIRPLPGVDRNDLLRTLIELRTQVGNARSAGRFSQVYAAYNSWANDAVRSLAGRVSAEDVDRLVLTRRYWLLLSMEAMAGAAGADQPRLGMLQVEIAEREGALGAVITSLEDRIKRWSRPGAFVIADTSVFYNGAKLDEWDVGGTLGTRHDPVHLLFPMVIVDELDRLKESRDKHKRWRAGYTLAVLDRVLAHGSVGVLREGDFTGLAEGRIPRGEVTAEIVLDPPGHVRLPIEDDEIVDRALAIEGLAGRKLTLVTYDTGQSHRARAVGLSVRRLKVPLEPEGG